MPVGATAHAGVGQSGTNQPLYLNDQTFIGGGTGLITSALGFRLKSSALKSALITCQSTFSSYRSRYCCGYHGHCDRYQVPDSVFGHGPGTLV